ncbi:MAG: PilN domain-containing protein [Dehalococcoidia bacterium]
MVPPAHIFSTEQETRRFRLLALVVVASTVFFRQQEFEDISLLPTVIVVVLFAIYTLGLGPLVLSRIASRFTQGASLVYLTLSMVAVDAVAVTLLVHYAGGAVGINNFAFILIPLFIMYHTIYLGYTSGLFSATLFSVLYVGTAWREGNVEGAGALLASQVALFYLLALFSSYLARKAMEARAEKDLLREFIIGESEAHGVRLQSVTYVGNTISLTGEAIDPLAMESYMEALDKMGSFAFVRLAATSRGEQQEPAAGATPFTIVARLK